VPGSSSSTSRVPTATCTGQLLYGSPRAHGREPRRRTSDRSGRGYSGAWTAAFRQLWAMRDKAAIPYREGMMKSRYIHRTFIAPDQRLRDTGVRMKLTPLFEHIRDKRLVLVDDSIVRATTTKQIVRLLFESGRRRSTFGLLRPPSCSRASMASTCARKGNWLPQG